MSQENVEIVLAAQLTDLVEWLKDDVVWSAFAARLHPDFEHASVNIVEGTMVQHNAARTSLARLGPITRSN